MRRNLPITLQTAPRQRSARAFVAGLILVIALALPLAACSSSSGKSTTPAASAATSTSTTVAPSGISSPTVATPAVATPARVATPAAAHGSPTPIVLAGTPVASPSSATTDAIKSVIERANQEQQQAYASQDPTVMQDTSTPSYYVQLVQGLRALASSGVAEIKLVNLSWGPIALQGTTAAQATTSETWSTTFQDGTALQETDTNVYTLALQGGSWKIAADEHPDTRRLQPPPGVPGATPAPGTTGSAGSSDQSRNWAGYEATGGTFTAVTGSWTVPNVSTAAEPAADATWVGIGGVVSRDLIQAGTDATVQSGQVTYEAWVETLPQAAQPVQLTVNPGDSITVSITQQSTGSWQIVIQDNTSGQKFQTSITYQSSLSSAEWVEESPAAGRRVLLPLDNFGQVAFSKATTTENGQQQTIAQAHGQPITLVTTNGQPLAQPSPLGADGESFSVKRTNAAAPSLSPGTGDVPGPVLPS